MKKQRNRNLSISAIIIGFVLAMIFYFNYLFIDYFSSIGLRESVSTFGFSVLLMMAGVINLKSLTWGRSLLWSYSIGSILERVLILILYCKNISIDILILPLLSSVIIIGLLFYSKGEIGSYKRISVIISATVALLIALLPKVIF